MNLSQKLLEADDFYRIRVASNLLSPPGRDYVMSSVKAVSFSLPRRYRYFILHALNVFLVNCFAHP
jgi:ER membrane protein complex subunit 10